MLPFYLGILPSETAEEALRKDKHVKDEQVAAQVITADTVRQTSRFF